MASWQVPQAPPGPQDTLEVSSPLFFLRSPPRAMNSATNAPHPARTPVCGCHQHLPAAGMAGSASLPRGTLRPQPAQLASVGSLPSPPCPLPGAHWALLRSVEGGGGSSHEFH